MNEPQSLSGLDSAFLSLETPTTSMHVMGVFVLDASSAGDGYSYERVFDLIEQRAPRLAPFRRRLIAMPFDLDHPVWVDDPDFDVRNHVHKERAPAPGTERILADLVARLASQPLDRARPLWQLWVIDGLSEDRVALVFKLHHAVADGVSASLLLLRLLTSSPDGLKEGPSKVAMRPPRAPTSVALLAHAASRLPERSARFGRLVRDVTGSVGSMVQSILGGTPSAPHMAMPFSAPRMPWNRAISSERTVAFGAAPLADVKMICSVFDTTVNHVILAACTQTLRGYLEAHGGAPDIPLVAAIPVSVRTADEIATYGNRISALLVHLPIHLTDPEEQLLALRNDAAASAEHHARLGATAFGDWAEFVSAGFLKTAASFYADHRLADRHRPLHNLVISNVRGPAVPLHAAGARMTAAYPLGPLMEGAGMNITVMSYAGSVDFGVVACKRAVPSASDIALGFGTAVAALHKIALEIALEKARCETPSPAERGASNVTPSAPGAD